MLPPPYPTGPPPIPRRPQSFHSPTPDLTHHFDSLSLSQRNAPPPIPARPQSVYSTYEAPKPPHPERSYQDGGYRRGSGPYFDSHASSGNTSEYGYQASRRSSGCREQEMGIGIGRPGTAPVGLVEPRAQTHRHASLGSIPTRSQVSSNLWK